MKQTVTSEVAHVPAESKLEIILEHKGDMIDGRINLPADCLFTLECLNIIVENVAQQTGQTPDAVMQDLYVIVMGHITRKKDAQEVCI